MAILIEWGGGVEWAGREEVWERIWKRIRSSGSGSRESSNRKNKKEI